MSEIIQTLSKVKNYNSQKMSEIELLPCPFCGGKAEVRATKRLVFNGKYMGTRRNHGGIIMTMFDPDTPDIDKKLQEIEDEEMKDVFRRLGDSDEEIEFAVRRTHLRERIWKLEEILCEPEEILDILSEEGWKREEIEDEMKQIE